MKTLLSLILTMYSIGGFTAPCVQTSLPLSPMFHTGGFEYVVGPIKLGVQPDYAAQNPLRTIERSPVRLFENGTELGPAHAVHADIKALGHGRFSHWGSISTPPDGGADIRFSTSDNSDPRSNGKAYTYCVGVDAPVTTTTMPPPPTTTTTTTLPLCSEICRSPAPATAPPTPPVEPSSPTMP